MSLVRRVVGRVRGAGSAPAAPAAGVVSVVVPVYQARPYLDECLVSVREQTHTALQIVVVDDGSSDGSDEVYERHAALDPRIVVRRQENRGLGAARTTGIAAATGEYLTFLDADDTLPPDAYARLVASLVASGSDFALGAVQRVTHGVRRTPGWIAEVHDRDRVGVTIDGFPRAVFDVIACNRLFRKDFWDRAGLAFPTGVAYEDHVPMMAAYVRATAFDVLEETTYYWRIREDATSIGQQKHQVDNLRDRLRAKAGAEELLAAEASAEVLRAWRSRVLDMDLPLFVERVPEADEDYFAVLRDGVRHHLAAADAAVLADVRAERRARLVLVAEGRRAELVDLVGREATQGPVGPTTVHGDRVVADLAGIDLPEEVRTLTARQTRLETRLRGARLGADGVLELDLSSRIPDVDLSGVRPSVRAWWVDAEGGRVPAEATSYDDPEITRAAQPTCADFAPAGVRIRTDAAGLAAGTAVGDAPQWHLELEVAARGLRRTGTVTHRLVGSGALAPLAVTLADGLRLWLGHDREHGTVLHAGRSVATLVSAEVSVGDLRLTVAATAGQEVRRVGVVLDGDEQVLAGVDGGGAARLPLARVRAGGGARWPVRVRAASAASPLAWPVADPATHRPLGADLLLRRNDTGGVVLVAVEAEHEVLAVEAGPRLRLALRALGATPSARPVLRGRPGPGGTPATLPLTAEGDRWWRLDPPLADLPLARWALVLVPDGAEGAGAPPRVRLAPEVLAVLPLRAVGATSRTVVERTREGLDVAREPEPWAPMA